MSLKPVRTYIKDRLTATDSSFKEHTDGFNTDNIGRNTLDKSYHILVDSVDNQESGGNYVQDSISIKVQLYYKGYRNIQSAIDSAIDQAHDFKLRAINPANWTSTVKSVVCDNIRTTTLDANDNVVIMEIDLTIMAASAVI
tara:strand:- start:446 stop:868 length:423 start_codon:yes stop_codon:yes gene_type:complete